MGAVDVQQRNHSADYRGMSAKWAALCLAAESIEASHAHAVMLATCATTSWQVRGAHLGQWREDPRQQDEQDRDGSPTSHQYADSSRSSAAVVVGCQQPATRYANSVDVTQKPFAVVRQQEELLRYLIALLALAGVVVSYLALRVHNSTETAPCSINEKWDCGIVNHSPYAVMYGVPVAAIGIAGYLLIAILSLWRRRALVLLATLIGLAFALYLTNIEAKVLGVWCLYCVISQCIIALITLLAIGWMVGNRMRER
jgi:uncharacterized membrane protein